MSPTPGQNVLRTAACTLWLALCSCEAVEGGVDASTQNADTGAPPATGTALDAASPADATFTQDAPSEHRDGAAADATTVIDGAVVVDAALDTGYRAPCTVGPDKLTCEHTITDLTFAGGSRKVYWAAPIGEPPAAGFPLALIFQGSFFGPSFTWGELTPDLPFGGFYQGLLHVALLEAGFVVVEPEAEGGIAWQTNGGGNYDTSTDHALMLELFARFANTDDFGPVDDTRLYATGISSGGYMTSRMAVSHPGKMRALAIQSGSYATCLGPLCTVPAMLPTDHPPTLFLHGDEDLTVGIDTARAYHDALVKQGIETEMIVGKGVGHAWLESAPKDVTAWFVSHAH